MADRNIRLAAGVGRPQFGRPLAAFPRTGFQGAGIQRPAWQRAQGVTPWTPPWLTRAQLWREAQLQAKLAVLDTVRGAVAKEVGVDTGGTAPYDTSSASAGTSTTATGFALTVAPSPPDQTTGVALTTPDPTTGAPAPTPVEAAFSGPIDPSTLSTATFTLTPDGGTALTDATVTYDAPSYTAILSPKALAPGTTYTARLDQTIRDSVGDLLGSPITWTFTTAPAAAAPSIASQSPAPGETAASMHGAVTVTFVDDMDTNSITDGTFTVADPNGALVAGRVDYDPATKTAILTPQAALAAGTTYTVRLDSAIRSSGGAALSAASWTFTTASGVPPAPTGPPTVTAMVPANQATGVATSTTVTATFSGDMDEKSITQGTFTLTPSGGAAVSASVSYDASTRMATLTPTTALVAGTTYTARLDSAIRDKSGSTLVADCVWTFTTDGTAPVSGGGSSTSNAPAPATTPAVPTTPAPITTPAPATAPTPLSVTGTSPSNGATGAGTGGPLTATFSTAMDTTTIGPTSLTLTTAAGAAVAATVTYDAPTNTISLMPAAPLSPSTGYTASLDPSIRSAQGAQLGAPYTWGFTTGTAATQPGVSATSPANGSANVSPSSVVTATFSEAMDQPSVVSGFTLAKGATLVAASVTYDTTTNTATLTPQASLDPSTAYTATLAVGVTASAGGTLPAPVTWTFTTAAAAPAPPTASQNPAPGSTEVSTDPQVSATFSTSMKPETINAQTFTLTVADGGSQKAVNAKVSYDEASRTATLVPSSLEAASTYTATLSQGVTDAAGTPLAAPIVWTFSTSVVEEPETPNHEVAFAILDTFPAEHFTDDGLPKVGPFNEKLADVGEPPVNRTTREIIYNAYVRRRVHQGLRFATADTSIRFDPPDEVIMTAFESIRHPSQKTHDGYPSDKALTKVLGDLGYEGVHTARFHPLWDQHQEKAES
jgi:Big-like domain-containing protein